MTVHKLLADKIVMILVEGDTMDPAEVMRGQLWCQHLPWRRPLGAAERPRQEEPLLAVSLGSDELITPTCHSHKQPASSGCLCSAVDSH